MHTYLILIRGINVGGKNRVSMASLKTQLEKLGYKEVKTYINSGNVIVTTTKNAAAVKREVETVLPKHFTLDDELIKVLIVSRAELAAVVREKPKSFGDNPEKFYSDVVFLIDLDVEQALKVFSPKEGVDRIWPGKTVVYSERLGAQRTKSRLNRIIGTPEYKSMTIRNWNTVVKLLDLVSA